MSEVGVRSLASEDPGRVLELWRKAGLPHRPVGRDTPDSLERGFTQNSDLCLGAYVRGNLVGTVLATDDGRKGWVNRLAVDPDHRHRGIGTELLQRAEKALRDRGRRIIAALIEDWNSDSLSFFRARGYHLHRGIQYLSKRESDQV